MKSVIIFAVAFVAIATANTVCDDENLKCGQRFINNNCKQIRSEKCVPLFLECVKERKIDTLGAINACSHHTELDLHDSLEAMLTVCFNDDVEEAKQLTCCMCDYVSKDHHYEHFLGVLDECTDLYKGHECNQ